MAFVSEAEAVPELKSVIVSRLHGSDTFVSKAGLGRGCPGAGINRAENSATSAYARLPLGGIAEGCWINRPFN